MIPKFRAFYKANQKMYEVLTLDIIDKKAFVENNDDPGKPLRGYANISEIELMQSTGLKDKNGTEIYEGDILYFKKTLKQPSGDLTHEVTGQVQYRKGMPQLDGKTKQMQGDEENEHESRSILLSPEIYKVIGNIFENPELIERQEARHD